MYLKTGVKHPLVSDKIPSFGKLQTAGKNTEKKHENFTYYIRNTFQKLWEKCEDP